MRSGTLGGFLMLYALAGMRRFRRATLRHQIEKAGLEQWLDLVARLAPQDYALAVETVNCRRLVKGYSDTHVRGGGKYRQLLAAAEKLAGRPDAPPACARCAKRPWPTRNAAPWNASWPTSWRPETPRRITQEASAVQTLKLIVREVRQESPLIRSFRLAREDGALPAFGPGAHLNISVPGLREPRSYSLVQLTPDAGCFAAPGEYRLGVRLEEDSQGGSRHMHALVEGDTLAAEGPRNDFPLHEAPAGDEPVLLIAGGIGITPVASMAAALRPPAAPSTCITAAAARTSWPSCPSCRRWPATACRCTATTIPPAASTCRRCWTPPRRASTCTSAAPGLIDAVIAGAKARHWPDAHVHFELFATAAPQAGDQPFEVELRQSGRVLTIPADKTIVDVMEEEGCDPMYDCKRGECGVCQATVLEGEPDHRDYYLSDTEKASGKIIQICISRAKSARLVLDL